MMKTTVYIATSVDGFIARQNGAIDWLPDAVEGEDYGYQKFFDSVDVLVMGRKTYELALSFEVWPYDQKPVIVLSHQPLEIPDALANTVESMNAPPRHILRHLAERGFQHGYIDGGQTIQGFLREGLIQYLIITTVPILIGGGIALFGLLPQDVRLRHRETRSFANGLVQSQYEVMGNWE